MRHPSQKFESQNIITTIKHSVQVSGQIALPHKKQIKLTTQTKNYTARSTVVHYKKVVFFFFLSVCLSQEQVDFFFNIYRLAHTAISANAPLFFPSCRKWKAYNTSSIKVAGQGASLSGVCQGEMRAWSLEPLCAGWWRLGWGGGRRRGRAVLLLSSSLSLL